MATTIEELRGVQWSLTHDWDINFPTLRDISKDSLTGTATGLLTEQKIPFLTWFPATSVSFPLYNIKSKEFDLANIDVKIPVSQGTLDLRIIFMDDENAVLENLMEKWVKEVMFNKNKGTSSLIKCVKPVIINKLNVEKIPVKSYVYLVYPDGSFPIEFSADAKVSLYNQSFVIVKDLTDDIKLFPV